MLTLFTPEHQSEVPISRDPTVRFFRTHPELIACIPGEKIVLSWALRLGCSGWGLVDRVGSLPGGRDRIFNQRGFYGMQDQFASSAIEDVGFLCGW